MREERGGGMAMWYGEHAGTASPPGRMSGGLLCLSCMINLAEGQEDCHSPACINSLLSRSTQTHTNSATSSTPWVKHRDARCVLRMLLVEWRRWSGFLLRYQILTQISLAVNLSRASSSCGLSSDVTLYFPHSPNSEEHHDMRLFNDLGL